MPQLKLRGAVRHRPLPAQVRAAVGLSRLLNRSLLPNVVRTAATYRAGRAVAARLGPHAIGTATLRDGGRVKVPLAHPAFCGLWLDAPYEGDVVAFARAVLRAGDGAVDVGANVGVHAVRFAALVGSRGVVHAFEPSDLPARMLERSIALNGWEPRLILHRTALSDAPGTGTLYVNDAVGLYSGLDRHPWLEAATAQATPIAMLDDFPALTERPIRLVKIDVAGDEAAVLEGGRRLFARHPPEHVIIEVSSATDAAPAVDFLLERGYRPARPVANTVVAVPLGPLPAVSPVSPHDDAFSYRNICFSRAGAGATL